ncbi:MAG: dihydroorotase [Acidimicrobiia bacterium]|nr:dihydroorotase [Acidimicrobiia bacterium]
MTTYALVGGDIVDCDGRRRADVVVDQATGRLTEAAPDAADERLDVTGCIVSPGFVDLHVHLRQPGNEAAETIETGSRAAALGGYTAVVAMPNTNPCMDTAAVVTEVLAHGSRALCEIKPSAAITVGRLGETLAPMGELVDLGVRMFTDDGTGVQDDQLMRRALEYAASLDPGDGTSLVLSQHCEVNALSQGGVMNEGRWSAELGLPGQPAEAEELMVMRDIALSRLTGMRVHLQHLSTAGSVEMVRAAKAAGHPVTAEATPHHFTLTDGCCASYDPVFKVHPPLRTEADVAAVKAGLADGTIDAIATDHAPHTPDSKELPFDQAPPGMLGLETALALALTELPDIELVDLIRLLSIRPADIAGLADRHGRPVRPGEPANICVFDPDRRWTVDRTGLASLALNTPFHGRGVRGMVRHTFFDGEPVVIDGKATR